MSITSFLCAELEKNEKEAPVLRTPLPSSKRWKTWTACSSIRSSISPVRCQPPSPLRYQISETRPQPIPFAFTSTPTKPRFRSKAGKRKTGRGLLTKVLTPDISPPRPSKRMKKEVKIVPSPPPVRAHPPSPLRYQITQTPESVAFILPLTPTKHRHRGTTSSRLLRQVLAPIVQPLQEFNFLEDEIEIVNVISQGEHSTIFRIFAGEKFYALKIHRYERTTVPEFCSYPEPNPFFDAEYAAYARLAPYPSIHGNLIPKCHGLINFTSLPAPPTSPFSTDTPREPFCSRIGAPALYFDYITQHSTDTPKLMHSSPTWRAYFTTAPKNAVLLRGLVLDDLPLLRTLNPDILDSPGREYRSIAHQGTARLKDLHACGILHGGIAEENSVLVKIGDRKQKNRDTKDKDFGYMFLGFDKARVAKDFKSSTFRKLAKKEETLWESRWECLVVESQEKHKLKMEKREKERKDREEQKKMVRFAAGS